MLQEDVTLNLSVNLDRIIYSQVTVASGDTDTNRHVDLRDDIQNALNSATWYYLDENGALWLPPRTSGMIRLRPVRADPDPLIEVKLQVDRSG